MSDLEQMLNVDLSTDIVKESELETALLSYVKKEDGAISNASWIADRLIGGEKIGLSSISTDNIADKAIITEKIKAGAVTGSRIANQTLLDSNFADDSVSGSKLRLNTVAGAANSQDTSEEAGQIAYDTIGTVNLRDEAVTEDKISQGLKDKLSAIKDLSDAVEDAMSSEIGYPRLSSVLSGYVPIEGGTVLSGFYLSSEQGTFLQYNGRVFGLNASATGTGAQAIGPSSRADGHESLAVGNLATVTNWTATDSIALGFGATVVGSPDEVSEKIVQIGYGSNSVPNSVKVYGTYVLSSKSGTSGSDLEITRNAISSVLAAYDTKDDIRNSYTAISTTLALSGEIVDGLSNVLAPKINELCGLVQQEVDRIDGLSDETQELISTIASSLSGDISPKISSIADLVVAETEKIDAISSDLSSYVSKSELKAELQNGLSRIDLDNGGLTLKEQLQSIVSVLSGLMESL